MYGRVTTPNIINQTLTTQNQEYAVELPPGTVRLLVQARAADSKMSFRAGQAVNGPYLTIKSSLPPYEVVDVTGLTTVYLSSTTAGAVIELVCWT